MAATYTLPGGTIPVGPFAYGPFVVPDGASQLNLQLDISDPSNTLTLNTNFSVSYDGGATWVFGGGSTVSITNGQISADGGTTTGTYGLIVGFDSTKPATNRRVKVAGSAVGHALIIGTSTLIVS